MAVNLSAKYAKEIEQQFTQGSLVDGRLNNSVSFVDANVVKVYTIASVPLNTYDRTLTANRYGTPAEVQDTVQTLTMSQDKSFSVTIDKGNDLDSSIKRAGQFLRIEAEEVITPEMDKYKLGRLAAGAGTTKTDVAITGANVVARIAAGRAALLNKRVPIAGRTLFVTTDVFNALIDTDQFKNMSSAGEKALINGQVGQIFGSPVIEVPADLMPTKTNFIWVHRSAATAPVKINETKIHIDPPGLSGHLLEGRFYFDCFVLDAKKYGIYVDKTT